MALTTKQLFEKQIDCVCRGDREGQLSLYHEDIEFNFPFATDRPRKIIGREAFVRAMQPLWDQAEAAGIHIIGYKGDVHQSADDPGGVFAEFVLKVSMPDGTTRDVQFVQKMRAAEGKIISVNEYFSSADRATMTSSR
ncbi:MULTISPECIES: nuclear transport factor 2 family protein [unclassified Mesorhizobium]|uniref:nuclear transport factor 2 family protein n=1 Tax=unclassified Mesorhizobium TaxID=325217 RepID=UPI0030145B14